MYPSFVIIIIFNEKTSYIDVLNNLSIWISAVQNIPTKFNNVQPGYKNRFILHLYQ